MRQSWMPAISTDLVRMKYKSRYECDEMSSSAATAFGPCNAIRARASLSRNSIETALPCLLNRSYSQTIIKYNNEHLIHKIHKIHKIKHIRRAQYAVVAFNEMEPDFLTAKFFSDHLVELLSRFDRIKPQTIYMLGVYVSILK